MKRSIDSKVYLRLNGWRATQRRATAPDAMSLAREGIGQLLIEAPNPIPGPGPFQRSCFLYRKLMLKIPFQSRVATADQRGLKAHSTRMVWAFALFSAVT